MINSPHQKVGNALNAKVPFDLKGKQEPVHNVNTHTLFFIKNIKYHVTILGRSAILLREWLRPHVPVKSTDIF